MHRAPWKLLSGELNNKDANRADRGDLPTLELISSRSRIQNQVHWASKPYVSHYINLVSFLIHKVGGTRPNQFATSVLRSWIVLQGTKVTCQLCLGHSETGGRFHWPWLSCGPDHLLIQVHGGLCACCHPDTGHDWALSSALLCQMLPCSA